MIRSFTMSALLINLPGRIDAAQYRTHSHGNPDAGNLTIGCSVFMSTVFNE